MFFYILIGKIIVFISKLFNLGSGSTWPGHIVNYFDKNILNRIFRKNTHLKIIFIVGTNGKTTTTSLISFFLKKLNYRVFFNQEGANLLNGILSTVIKNSNLFGCLNYDFAIFEIDEFSFPIVSKYIQPDYVLILNIFRDQLDRYGEVNTIVLKWYETLKSFSKKPVLIINADDPNLYYIGKKLNAVFFGLNEKLMVKTISSSDKDFIYCPNCNSILNFKKNSYSHLGDFYCSNCHFKKDFKNIFNDKKIFYPLKGLYNVYNINASVTLIKYLFNNIKVEKINNILKKFKPTFGRQETINYKNRKINLILVKNPASFNQTIKTINETLKKNKANFLIVLNNRIPDGKDVSWIWDVDIGDLFKNIKYVFLSGDRLYDMCLRFIYHDNKIKKRLFFEENLKKSIDELINKSKSNEKIYFLATYSAMLELRKILLGKKLI